MFPICSHCQRFHPDQTLCPDCCHPITLVDENYFVGRAFGKYRVEEVLGRGGMGIVCRARHQFLPLTVAIKILVPRSWHASFNDRFQLEARLLATLKHPHIVEIHDLDVDPTGLPYLVMEHLSGRSLADEIDRHPGGMPWPLCRKLLHQMLAALAHAHSQGVVHRDLKPDNIFIQTIDDEESVKILDFGIAKILAPAGESPDLTQTGELLGTPRYLAPEQLSNREIGPYTDQYALALIAAEMLTGRTVRQGTNPQELMLQAFQPGLPPGAIQRSDLSGGCLAALERAADPDPTRRFPDLQEFEACLFGGTAAPGAVWRSGEDSLATAAGPRIDAPGSRTPAAGPVARRRHRWIFLAVGVGLLVLASVGAIRFFRGGRPAPAPREALLTRLRTVPLPPDARTLLGSDGETDLISGMDCVYLLDLKKNIPPTRMPLGRGERIIGPMDDGAFAVRSAGRLIRRRFILNDQEERREIQDRLLGANFSAEGTLYVSPSGTWAAQASSDGLRVYRIGATPRPAFTIPAADGPIQAVALGEQHAAILGGGKLRVVNLETHRAVIEAPFTEMGVKVFKVFDPWNLVVLAGWFDTVYVFHLDRPGAVTRITLPGQTQDVGILPDRPTLVLARAGRLVLWRPGEGVVAEDQRPEVELGSVALSSRGLLAIDRKTVSLLVYGYAGMPVRHRYQISEKEIWGLAAPAGALLAGGATGRLYRLDLATGAVTGRDLHTQGITAILSYQGNVATASDDKTVAVWKWPELQVMWRSEMHRYLVNALFLDPRTSVLWTSSSDGTIRSWEWPRLKPRDEIRLDAMSIAAIWVDPPEQRLLAGTWNFRLLVFRREGAGRWRLERTCPLPSYSGYSMAEVAGINAILLVGNYPAECYLYDWEREELLLLSDLGTDLFWCIPAGPSEVLAFGANSILRYRFSRENGDIRYRVGCAVRTDLYNCYIAAAIPGSGQLALGNGSGQVILLDRNVLPAATLPMPPPRPLSAEARPR